MFIVNREYLDMKVATEDICCYKILYRLDETTLVSPFIGFKYDFGAVYSIAKPLQKIPYLYANVVIDGFHSYKLQLSARNATFFVNSSDKAVIVKCVIPKGSEYFENAHEFVSSSLQMTEIDAGEHKGWEDYV